jgi:hypothetical protein
MAAVALAGRARVLSGCSLDVQDADGVAAGWLQQLLPGRPQPHRTAELLQLCAGQLLQSSTLSYRRFGPTSAPVVTIERTICL